MYKRWRLWLQEANRVDPPGRPADLVDYLLVLRDEPCARTVLVAIERVVLDDSEPTGLRVYAWAKLVKVWASLKWSDLQAIRPGELKLVEGRLVTTLRRTKTSGPNRRIKEMPLCVSEAAFFENPAWLKVGFELLHGSLWPRLLAAQAEAELCGFREEDGRIYGRGGRLGRYLAEGVNSCDSPGVLDRALREVGAAH